MTHKELVEIAYKWVLKRGSCGVAFKELRSNNIEIPDIIGFGTGFSSVIECKVSRSDFLQDKNKPHRQKGMGTFRYFCCPVDLIKLEDLPEKWGLLYVSPDGKCKAVKDVRKIRVSPTRFTHDSSDDYYAHCYPNSFTRNLDAENKLMYSVIRRLFIKGHIKHIYDKDYSANRNVDKLIEINKQ